MNPVASKMLHCWEPRGAMPKRLLPFVPHQLVVEQVTTCVDRFAVVCRVRSSATRCPTCRRAFDTVAVLSAQWPQTPLFTSRCRLGGRQPPHLAIMIARNCKKGSLRLTFRETDRRQAMRHKPRSVRRTHNTDPSARKRRSRRLTLTHEEIICGTIPRSKIVSVLPERPSRMAW
jgi:hypothetical protein